MRRWWGWGVVLALVVSGCGHVVPHVPRILRSRPPAQPPIVDGVQVGVASWYGPGFHGRRTANGEIFDQNEMTAAHPSLPHGTRVMVTNLDNGRAAEVRINDRGPFVGGRCIDLSYAAARTIGMIGPGTANVRLEVLPPERRQARLVQAAAYELPSTSYSVQVAALGDAARAEHLRSVLAHRFPDAFVSEVDGPSGRYYRVRIGPYALRGVAVARAELIGRLGYGAIIVEDDGR
jgi:peptidoglycan lytic transglycosylase